MTNSNFGTAQEESTAQGDNTAQEKNTVQGENTAAGKKLLIIDGNSLIHRAFHAIPLLTTSKGVITNAAYGFTNMLLKIINQELPDYLIVAFDKGKYTFRNRIYSDYKGTRKETPEELRPQFELIHHILQCMRVYTIELEDYEADDLIGTATLQAEQQGINSLILTGDRDDFQLISEQTQVLYTKKGISELELYDLAKLQERYETTPEQFIDLKGLMGDASDNIPGVPGIGEKTARKLLQQFGSLEQVLKKKDELSRRYQEKLTQYEEQARLSRGLATIERRVPLNIDWSLCLLQEPDQEALLQLFTELEFRGLVRMLKEQLLRDSFADRAGSQNKGGSDVRSSAAVDSAAAVSAVMTAAGGQQKVGESGSDDVAGNAVYGGFSADDGQGSLFAALPQSTVEYQLLDSAAELQKVLLQLSKSGAAALYLSDEIKRDLPWAEQEGYLALAAELPAIGAAADSQTAADTNEKSNYQCWLIDLKKLVPDTVSVQEDSTLAAATEALEEPATAESLAAPEVSAEYVSAKQSRTNDFYALLNDFLGDAAIKKYFHDVKRVYRLLQQNKLQLRGIVFDSMIAAYLLNPGRDSSRLAALSLEYLDKTLPETQAAKTAAQAQTVWRLCRLLSEQLAQHELTELFYELELPLAEVLAQMEISGVTVDPRQIHDMSEVLGARISQLTAYIYELAGEKFNINSTKQLGVILFEKMGLPVIKKTKTGYSTDAAVLEELALTHEIAEVILEYRQLVKLKSTYLDGLEPLINKQDGKIHTTFNQTITATGRLSSTEPNLQNIPIRMELGRQIRRVFIPRAKDYVFLAADYSQIELRVLAHMAGDKNMIDAFLQEQDIHTRTASEVFNVPMAEVTRELRSRAKAVNFGIVYGISDFGLAKDIKVSRKAAKEYIDSYFARYPDVNRYIDRTITEARSCGYVTTLFKRRRYLPDLFSSNKNTRSFGERTAMNTPIQGTAADIIKIAMLNVQRELNRRKLQSQMILQVHDELIFDVPQDELNEMIALVREQMEQVVQLQVPLKVDVKVGPSWYDVQKIQEEKA